MAATTNLYDICDPVLLAETAPSEPGRTLLPTHSPRPDMEGVDELMDVKAISRDAYIKTNDGWRFTSREEETLLVTGGRFVEVATGGLKG